MRCADRRTAALPVARDEGEVLARNGDAHAPTVAFDGVNEILDAGVEDGRLLQIGIHELMEAIGVVLARAPQVQFVLGPPRLDSEQMEAWLLPAKLRPSRSQIRFTG